MKKFIGAVGIDLCRFDSRCRKRKTERNQEHEQHQYEPYELQKYRFPKAEKKDPKEIGRK